MILPKRRLADALPRVLHYGAFCAVIGLLAVALFADHQIRTAFQNRQHSEVFSQVNLLRANLEGLVQGNVQLVRGLIAVIATEPEMDQARFAEIARGLVGDNAQIRNIAGAPDMVIRLMHPVDGNEAAVGLDYRAVPEQWDAARRVRDEATMVLAGPLHLVQGGEGLVARAPVLIGEPEAPEFWGIVATVIDAPLLYAASGLSDPELPIDVAVIGRDGLGAQGELFFGDAGVLSARPVTAEVRLPQGNWLIAAVPKGGWATWPPLTWLFWTAEVAFGALIVVPLLLAGRLAEDRQRTIRAIEERERELDRLSRRLDLALTASTVGVWDYNIDRDELIWDNRMNELYGMPGDKREHSYHDWRDRLHPDDLADAEATFQEAIEGRAKYNTKFRLRLPDGAIRHIRAIGAVYRDGDGTSKIVGVNWDVTVDVEREAELETKRREAEAASVAKSQFLATMSHEIRTPMSGVLGMLDLVLTSDLGPEQRKRAEIARASAQVLLAILNDILDLSKLEAERLTLEPVDTALPRLIDEVVALFRPQADEKGLELACRIGEAVPDWVVCDPVRLRQILVNLLSNAIKFTDAGGVALRVDYDPAQARLLIAVEDTGIGIGAAERQRLFHPFTQLDSSPARRAGGTGLGLAISRQLAALMAGTIAIESTPGQGSTFTVTIEARPGVARAAAAEPDGEAEPCRPLEILLVEDNETNQLIVNAMLERVGHRVTTVDNGHEALAVVAPGRFDLVLMDVQMPRMDGPSTTRAIRELGDWARRLPIIALTANAMAGDRERYLAAGMSDYLSKPIDPAALYAAVHRSAARPTEPEASAASA